MLTWVRTAFSWLTLAFSSRASRAKNEPTKPPEKRKKMNMQPKSLLPLGRKLSSWTPELELKDGSCKVAEGDSFP